MLNFTKKFANWDRSFCIISGNVSFFPDWKPLVQSSRLYIIFGKGHALYYRYPKDMHSIIDILRTCTPL